MGHAYYETFCRLSLGEAQVLASRLEEANAPASMGPLVARMGRATTTPVLAVASSALDEDGELSDLVSVIRQDEQLRDLVPTVDDLEHFAGWAAMILALRDVGEIGEVGHYGIDDTATRLLPPLRAP